ncbi:MAG: DUF3800 domain-containing protein [Chloroflexi bacterium]|nr:DUF3800 domain-containing protein [Chloroflexota bacterium]
MHIIYIDDSGDENIHIFSALSVSVAEWHEAFAQVKKFRRELKQTYGIYLDKELHAWKFISGRGRVSDRILTKSQRCLIFRNTLNMTTRLPGVRIFNAVFPKGDDERAFEWLLNRINRSMQIWGSYTILVCDEGKEIHYTRLVRRMYVHNPILSQYGKWKSTGQSRKNIPLTRIVEDPFFKDSKQSYFVQLVDFAAYALLRQESPLPSKTKYGLHEAFDELAPILVHEATHQDSRGIIRPYKKKSPPKGGE